MALLRHVNRCIMRIRNRTIDLTVRIRCLAAEVKGRRLLVASLRICDGISLAG
jgi:hypothetical protein